jgi:hypothetical protein
MAALYDGHSGVRHDVRVLGQPGLLLVDYGEGAVERVPVGELSLLDRSAGGLTIGRPAIDGWRLRIPPPVDPEVDLLFPRRHGYGGWVDRVGLWPAVAAFAAISGAVVALGYFAPTLLAPLVPESVERAYGDALVGDFGGKYCAAPAGSAALARLVGALDPQPDTLRVRVVDVPIVNAAALPAGQIVIFRPLLTTVESSDELAGILAHEIAHVRKRHVTAALVRQFGFGLLSSMIGGNVGGQVDGFVALSFTRRAEGEADNVAIERLQAARISPAPTARFFARLGKDEGRGAFASTLGYLSTHPLSKDREALFRKAAAPGIAYRPALSPAEWNALKMICAKPKSG